MKSQLQAQLGFVSAERGWDSGHEWPGGGGRPINAKVVDLGA